MDFDDSGIDSDPKLDNYTTFADQKEPIISFSPDRCRYDLPTSISGSTNDTASILSFANPPPPIIDPPPSSLVTNTSSSSSSSSAAAAGGGTASIRSLSQTNSTDLHRRLEKRIARANSTSNSNSPWTTSGKSGGGGEIQNGKENQMSRNDHHMTKVNNSQTTNRSTQEISNATSTTNNTTTTTTSTTSLVNLNALQQIPNCSSSTSVVQQQPPPPISSGSSGFDGRTAKVPTLLPPQRLAIPNKTHHSNLSSTNEGSSSEHKPLVQWESDESEEELSFFPAPRSRGILNENLSIDNMSLSGEEDDLHLSPPRPLSQRCPCDPRLLFDSSISNISSTSSSSGAAPSSPKHCCIS